MVHHGTWYMIAFPAFPCKFARAVLATTKVSLSKICTIRSSTAEGKTSRFYEKRSTYDQRDSFGKTGSAHVTNHSCHSGRVNRKDSRPRIARDTMSVTEERIQELNKRFLDFMSKNENVEPATKEIYDDLLDEVLMGFVFDVHRTTKTGSSDVEEGIPDDESYAIVDSPGLDVFGQHPVKKSQECNCPNCDRGVAACRFATHLEKCMGMGRNSSRIASRRIANNSKDLSNFGGVISDDDDDVDWSLNNDKRKRRKDRNGIKRTKQQKNNQRNGDNLNEHVHSSNENSPSNYENMSLEDKRILLTQICGVISEHTKKLCTRSMRCPQHTEDQRKEMRANLESGSNAQTGQDNLHVDVDTYEENDGQNLREALARWDREGSSHSSPADSTSTTSTSSISRKRETKTKGKGKGSKRDRGSPISQGD